MSDAVEQIALQKLDLLERVVNTYETVLDEANAVASDKKARADAERVRGLVAKKEECRDDWLRHKRAFKSEVAKLDEERAARLSETFKRLQTRYRGVREEYAALGLSDASARDELLDAGGGRGRGAGGGLDLETAGNSEVLGEAHAIEKEGLDKLDGALRDITEAVTIGSAAAGRLKDQGHRLESAKEELGEIQGELDIAKKLIGDLTRRLYTDKVIIAFVTLILLAIVGIVIFATLVPDQKQFDVPSDAKPPTNKKDVVDDDDGSSSRLLRGVINHIL